MSFELESPTNAKILEVIVLAEKDRAPDTNPGAGLDVSITTSNSLLTTFDGALRGVLYTKNANSSPEQKQATLDGVEPVSDLPNLTELGKKLGSFSLDVEYTGYSMVIDRGMGGKSSDLDLTDCKLSGFKFKPKEGGSVEIKFRVESPDISEKLHGQLALMKTTERPITLTPPEVDQQDIGG